MCCAAAFLTPPHYSTFSFEYVPARAKSKMNSTPPTLKKEKGHDKIQHSRRLLVTHMNVNITVLLNT